MAARKTGKKKKAKPAAATPAPPRSDAEVEAEARALEQEGRHAEAAVVLLRHLHDLVGHGKSTLPCLCKACLASAGVTASAGGQGFFRDFVTSGGRVLFYWAPGELEADRIALRRSMRNALAIRVDALRCQRRRERDTAREGR